MSKYVVSISKTIQEQSYSPFTIAISKEFEADSNEAMDAERALLEQYVDDIIENRLMKIKELQEKANDDFLRE